MHTTTQAIRSHTIANGISFHYCEDVFGIVCHIGNP